MGRDLSILQRRTFCKGEPLGAGFWRPLGMRGPLGKNCLGSLGAWLWSVSNHSSTCGQFFDIYPVIYVMSLGQDWGLNG